MDTEGSIRAVATFMRTQANPFFFECGRSPFSRLQYFSSLHVSHSVHLQTHYRNRFCFCCTMTPRNTLIITPDTQIVLTVKCEVPEANETIRLRATIGTYNCQWLCTLRNETPQLEISLEWSIDDGCQHLCPPPEGVRALRIL